jgi:ribonuclease III
LSHENQPFIHLFSLKPGALLRILVFFKRLVIKPAPKDQQIEDAVRNITGHYPHNLQLFKLAMQHSSVAKENKDGYRESNERLEYLGDAILGAVVAEFLFKKYPYKDEGFLTEIRSRLVSRESLGVLARKIGLEALIDYDSRRKSSLSFKNIYGDAMEAFVGAVYLDRGYRFCRRFIIKKLLEHHYDIEEVVENDTNYKSKLIEWAQRNSKAVRFEQVVDKGGGNQRQFRVQVMIDNEVMAKGNGYSKKKAEQDAARKACEVLHIEQ